MLTSTDVIVRLVAAAFLGGVLGLEREQMHKVAGLRTHALVALGAALVSLLTLYLYEAFPSVNGVGGLDYHLVANVLVGIGFVGGGAILRNGTRVTGTTTAATLWVVACIGLAIGFGFVYAAFIATLICYIILTLVWYLELKLLK
jgi:putative Mg2+ transporter-C (MgtC) family protein